MAGFEPRSSANCIKTTAFDIVTYDVQLRLLCCSFHFIGHFNGKPQVSLTAPNRNHFAPVSLTLI